MTALANGTYISTNITDTPGQMTDLKIEIWSPIAAVVVLALIVFLIVYCVKRKNAEITGNSDDEAYATYGSDDFNNTTRKASYSSHLYTAYGDNGLYTEYEKPKK